MREQSTLHLTRTSVSWLSRGSQPEVLRRGLSSAEVPVAIEAKAMLKESGQRAGACTLALDESHYKRRQLDLPAGLVARELTQVLSRKADALVGSEDKAVFYAIPLHGNRKSRSEGKRAWLLYAIGSKKLTVLTDELRRAGFRVKRIVAAEVAYHGGLSLPTLDKTEAAIQIGQLESGIGVSLFSKSGLVSQNVVPTGELTREARASALVQELRSMDSYWRQVSEGGRVTHAVLSGFDESYSDQVTPAAQMVLPNIELHFDRDLPEVNPAQEQLIRMLSNCKKPSPLATEFTLVRPPHKLLTSTLVGASVACALTLGGLGQAELETLAGSLEGVLRMRLEEVSAIDKRESIQADIDFMRAIKDDYSAEWRAFLKTAETGIPYSQICAGVLQAIGSDGALESLDVSNEDALVGIHMTGVVPSDSTAAAAALDSIRARLIQSGEFENLQVSPEARVPGHEVDSHLLRFTISGTWSSGFDLFSKLGSTL